MLLKEIGRKIAQAFRLARAADEKVASSIAAALDAKAEQIKEYEKRFEPEHPEDWNAGDQCQDGRSGRRKCKQPAQSADSK